MWRILSRVAAYFVAGHIYCRRRQNTPGFTAHIVAHRQILSPATICHNSADNQKGHQSAEKTLEIATAT